MYRYDWFRDGKATVLLDGQFGSTGKGLFAAYVAETGGGNFDIATTNAGPNSGHTAIFDGKPKVAYHLPMSAIVAKDKYALLNAGSIIDIPLLIKEVKDLEISPENVLIHPNAAIISEENKHEEKDLNSHAAKIASTQKGVGNALADKIKRNPNACAMNHADKLPFNITPIDLGVSLRVGSSVFVEVSQGHSLSLNASGFWPHTTSRDCTLNQALSDANIHPSYLHRVIMTLRTHPIRVGNIVDGEETKGVSGDCYPDQKEISFEEIGVEPEYTTVTKRKRRVFTWSRIQVERAFQSSQPTDVFLNFVNYLKTVDQLNKIVESIIECAIKVRIRPPNIYYGFGPNHLTDVEYSYQRALDRLERENAQRG